MELTAEQKSILATVKKMQSGESLKIDACAGSGKTWILSEIARQLPSEKFLYLAFNKSIIEEAKKKLGSNVTVKTTHSLAYTKIVASNSIYKKKNNLIGKLNIFHIKPLFPDVSNKKLADLLDAFDHYLNSSSRNPSKEICLICEAVRKGIIPLTHSFYLKEYQLLSAEEKNLDRYDWILLDEAQDTNEVTLSIFRENDCKKIAVGDTQQSIYAFRGAINALPCLKTDYSEQLSVSFRCAPEIIEKVNWALSINHAQEHFKLSSMAQPHEDRQHAYISRTNSSLIELISTAAKQNQLKKIRLLKQPDDLFKACFNIRKLDNGSRAFDQEFKYFSNFDTLTDLKDYIDENTDQELNAAINIYKKYQQNLDYLYQMAEKLYSNDNGNIILCNAHISKGLEFHEVTLWQDFPDLFELQDNCIQDNGDPQEFIQEVNLYYVALTRCKSVLHDLTATGKYYVTPDKEDTYNNTDLELIKTESSNTVSSPDLQEKENKVPQRFIADNQFIYKKRIYSIPPELMKAFHFFLDKLKCEGNY